MHALVQLGSEDGWRLNRVWLRSKAALCKADLEVWALKKGICGDKNSTDGDGSGGVGVLVWRLCKDRRGHRIGSGKAGANES